VFAAVSSTGAACLVVAIAVRRQSRTLGAIVLLFAALWNAGIVFAFMSPHTRHVFHLATHQKSVVVNAAIGVVWLVACVFSVLKWFRSAPPGSRRYGGVR